MRKEYQTKSFTGRGSFVETAVEGAMKKAVDFANTELMSKSIPFINIQFIGNGIVQTGTHNLTACVSVIWHE